MTRSERACQPWAVLAWAARNRQILTHDVLGKLDGGAPPALGGGLDPIHSYCFAHGLPPLTILVVQQERGLPEQAFTAASASELAKRQMAAFEFDWLTHGNPPPAALG